MLEWKRKTARVAVSRSWLPTCAALLLGLYCAAAAAQVSVSSSGGPNYDYPIAVPPGIAGMQPNLGLRYSGSGLNGPVGYGWSVQGLSIITRCSARRHIDGVVRAVTFTPSDKLCLDGQRLIQTSASGVVSPTQADDARGLASGWREYRTENDSFARIRAYDQANGSADNGPAYFRVWTKSGQVYEYGAAPSINAGAAIAAQGKSVVMVWAVARISDMSSNYVDFKYSVRDVPWGSGPSTGPTLGREWNIAEIQYTGNSTLVQAPANKIVFRYVDRTQDRSEGYHQGAKYVSIRLLQGIDSYVNTLGTAIKVRSTNLTYDNGPVTKRSRLVSIAECSGASTPVCQPATRFNYAASGGEAFVPNTSTFNLGGVYLYENNGSRGVEVGDFNGDGKTDLLRWGDPTQNALFLSQGGGRFEEVPRGTGPTQFNITTESIYSDGGCVASLIMDFNGDGLTDIFKYVSQGADGLNCGTAPAVLFLSRGNGNFDRREITVTSASGSNVPLRKNKLPLFGPGETFYVLDVDGDGYPDIVTASVPVNPNLIANACASTTCTRVFKGNGVGSFTEIAAPSVVNNNLYQWPSGDSGNRALAQQRYVADVDGDGLSDIVLGSTGPGGQTAWRSLGDGNFAVYTTPTDADDCKYRMDFNGDGRAGCLWPSSDVTNSRITVSTGTQLQRIGNFDLAVTGGPGLKGDDKGVRTLDFNGDGRTDILRWHDDGPSNFVYLSNGDGTFTRSSTFNLNTSERRLVTSGNSFSFVTGDFTGSGSLEILRLKHDPSTGEVNTNQLYVKADPTPPDALLNVISPTGLMTTLTYGSLAALAPPKTAQAGDLPLYRYYSDSRAGTASTYPVMDLTPPSSVVITTETDVGVGTARLKTEYAYRGLKLALDGRGVLGFRQMLQQSTAPNGSPTTVTTTHLQLDDAYTGMPQRIETRLGTWNGSGQLLSTTTNTYCDRTSTANADTASETAPCASAAKVRRPYLRRSVTQGTDLAGLALPTVTTVNSVNDYGDPTDIVTTTVGSFAAATQTYSKTTRNEYCAPDSVGCVNKTSGDNWILGRLNKSTVTNKVPNLLDTLTASAGDAPNATAIRGTGVSQLPFVSASAATITASSSFPAAASGAVSFSNTSASVTTLTLTAPAGMSVSPSSLTCPASGSCGTVTVTSAASVGNQQGALGITSSAGGSMPTVALNFTVNGSRATLTSNAALAMGSVAVASTAPEQAWSFRNDGTVTMSLTLSALNSPFGLVSNTCTNVALSGTCAIRVRMATDNPGSFSQSNIVVSGVNQGGRGDLSISGTSVASGALFTVTGPSGTTWTFRNPNGTAVTIRSVGLYVSKAGTGARISGGTCAVNASIPANGTCTVTVSAPFPGCKPDNYSVRPTVGTAAGVATGSLLSRTNNSTICP
jgi:FG-GAP-like repeat/Salmonella virulence plasmid 65kDa B protein